MKALPNPTATTATTAAAAATTTTASLGRGDLPAALGRKGDGHQRRL